MVRRWCTCTLQSFDGFHVADQLLHLLGYANIVHSLYVVLRRGSLKCPRFSTISYRGSSLSGRSQHLRSVRVSGNGRVRRSVPFSTADWTCILARISAVKIGFKTLAFEHMFALAITGNVHCLVCIIIVWIEADATLVALRRIATFRRDVASSEDPKSWVSSLASVPTICLDRAPDLDSRYVVASSMTDEAD